MSDPTSSTATGASGVALFVRRPILAFVLSALIVIAGIAGLFGVEIRELPSVDRPVISITTEFSGASPETVDQEVTGRIEGAAGRVSGVRNISSNSRFGRSRVTLEFEDSVDIDVAATDTRDVIARIGHDRFVVLLGDVPRSEVMVVAKRLMAAIAAPLPDGSGPAAVTATAALAYQDGLVDLEELYDAAESAVRSGKRSGGGKLVLAA